jgi:hypothetical protein
MEGTAINPTFPRRLQRAIVTASAVAAVILLYASASLAQDQATVRAGLEICEAPDTRTATARLPTANVTMTITRWAPICERLASMRRVSK